MAADLAGIPLTGLRVQACGDAYVLNFGDYGSPERNLLFDVNDFDETLPGAWEWDVLRLATSVELAGRERGFGRQRTRAAVLAVSSTYRKSMWNFAGRSPLEIWYRHIDLRNPPPDVVMPLSPFELKRRVREAQARTGTRMLTKLTASDPPRFIDQPPTMKRIGLEDPEAFHAEDVLAQYRASLAPPRPDRGGAWRRQSPRARAATVPAGRAD